MCLKNEHITIIEEFVAGSGISYSHLGCDLTDHICCDIEQEIENGSTFETAFAKVKEQIGIEGLKQIEEQTILLINQNYILMKKMMKILAITIVSSFGLGAVMKTVHLPGASLLILLGLALVIGGYIPLLFLSRNKEDLDRKNVAINISGYIASTVFAADLLFYLFNWPYTDMIRIFSWISGFIFLIFFFKSILKKDNNATKATQIGIIVLLFIVIYIQAILHFHKFNADYLRYDAVITNIHEQRDLNTRLLEKAYHAFYKSKAVDEQTKKNIEQLKELFNAARFSILSFSEEIEKENDFDSFRFFDNKSDKHCENTDIIKQKIDALKQAILQTEKDSLTLKFTSQTLETNKVGHSYTEQLLFNRPLIVVRNNLMKINNDLLYLEQTIVNNTLQSNR